MHLWNALAMINDGTSARRRRTRPAPLRAADPLTASRAIGPPSDRVAEGMRELEKHAANPDVALPVSLALIHGHKMASTVDRDAVKDLEVRAAAVGGRFGVDERR